MPRLIYSANPKPIVIVEYDQEPRGLRGYIWPKGESLEDLRFNSTIRQVAEQNNLEPVEVIKKLVEGTPLNFDPSIRLRV
ncbi:MAG TPA: hypothetical protein VKC53_00320 [Patescibacteria group bacterium]|nr:hypothetical protein [Patescibacteria group bacterium]